MPRSASHLSLHERVVDDACLVAIAGELDLLTASEVRARLENLIRSGPNDLIVDLSAVTVMDSSGLAVLLDAWHSLCARDRIFSLVCPPGPVRTTLEITGLDEALPLYSAPSEVLSR